GEARGGMTALSVSSPTGAAAPVNGAAGGSEPECPPQVVHPRGGLPRELLLRTAEVPVGGRLLVDGPPQVEVAGDGRRPKVEQLADGAGDLRGVDLLRAERLD